MTENPGQALWEVSPGHSDGGGVVERSLQCVLFKELEVLGRGVPGDAPQHLPGVLQVPPAGQVRGPGQGEGGVVVPLARETCMDQDGISRILCNEKVNSHPK